MGIEQFENVPYKIRKAKIEGNTKYLSAAGKKGAEDLKNKRERERTEDEIFAELADEAAALEELERRHATNEHILTPDGKDPYEED